MLRVFFFVFFGAAGILIPFFGPYLKGLGFSARQVAVVLSVSPLLGLSTPLLWAWLADRTGRHVAVLRGLCAGALCGALCLAFARQYFPILIAMSCMAVFSTGIVPLADSMASATVEQSGRYARTRLWGSLGFVVTSLGGGLLLERRATDSALDVPLLLAGAYALSVLVALGLRVTPKAGERPRLTDMKGLLGDPRLRLLLCVAGLHWGTSTPYTMLFGILVKDRALSASITGAAFALGVAVEIGVLHQFSRLAARFGREQLLSVAIAATAIRWLLVAQAESAWALIALQSLHGFTFGLFWAATVGLLTSYVPESLRASGQALLGTALAAGNLCGYYSAGSLYDASGSAALAFAVAGAVELVPLVLALRFRVLKRLEPLA